MLDITTDITLIGGGIAGLWLLNRLKKKGYQALLIESHALGQGQTIASQGIIHGGTKYALTGKLTQASQAIQNMPNLWHRCIHADPQTAAVDLSGIRILSAHQYLWANPGIASQLSGFFASKLMHSRMQRLPREKHMAPFDNSQFRGSLYQLNEPVLDTRSVLQKLHDNYPQAVRLFCTSKMAAEQQGFLLYDEQQQAVIKTRLLVLTAGAGNAPLLQMLQQKLPKMQLRPLQMPMLYGPDLPPIYAHCLGPSALPRLTITSYPHLLEGQKTNVWYLGGSIAEKGVSLSQKELIERAKKELAAVMPWLNFSHTCWSSLNISRAEPLMPQNQRPVEPFVQMHNNVITCWPVKLAMTPLMADAAMKLVSQVVSPNANPVSAKGLRSVTTAQLPWQKEDNWQC